MEKSTGTFAAPGWLRDAGFTAWLLVGIALLIASIIGVLSLTQSIFLPLLAATVIATVTGPLVGWLKRHRIPRGLGSLLVLLLVAGAGALVGYLIITGIASQTSGIGDQLRGAVNEIEGWLTDLGAGDKATQSASEDVSSGVDASFKALKNGLVRGIAALSGFAFFLVMTVLSLFFLLKDGPTIRAWVERNMGLPPDIARTITSRTMQSLRGYFLGVTIVAAFNSILVGGGALLLGVPLAGTIAMVTFLGAYVPYIGAWTAGFFSVLIALGGASPEAATGMIAIQLVSNGPLQQIVQPIAYGATLDLHPLAVLVVTIAGGSLFGAAGLILAAPITSAIVRITADLSPARSNSPSQAAQPSRPAPT